MAAHHVRLPNERREVRRRGAMVIELGQRDVGIAGQDPDVPRPQQVGEPAAHPAQADDPHRDAFVAIRPGAHIGATEAVVHPLARPHLLVPLPQLLQKAEHGPQGGLGHAPPVRLRGRVGHHDPQVRGGVRVHVIDANGVLGHHPEPVGALHDPPGYGRAPDHGAHEDVALLDYGAQLIFVVAVPDVRPRGVALDQLAAGILQQLERIFAAGDGGKDEDLAPVRHVRDLDVEDAEPPMGLYAPPPPRQAGDARRFRYRNHLATPSGISSPTPRSRASP